MTDLKGLEQEFFLARTCQDLLQEVIHGLIHSDKILLNKRLGYTQLYPVYANPYKTSIKKSSKRKISFYIHTSIDSDKEECSKFAFKISII